MNTKSLTLALALTTLATLSAAGCGTEDVRGDVLVSSRIVDGKTPDPGLGSWLFVYLSQSQCAVNTDCPMYRLRIDGQFVVWSDSYEFVAMLSENEIGLIIPSGPHVISLVGDDGAAIATTGTVEAKPDMFHHLAVFGSQGALVNRWLVDDPAQVPAGMLRVRVVNALAEGNPIEPLHCTDPATGNCTSLGAPVAHGGVIETDAALADLEQQTIGWRVADVADAAFNGVFYRSSGPTPPSHTFHMPLRLNTDPSCPTCVGAFF